MSQTKTPGVVLAIQPTTVGMGFALLSRPQQLVDWGYCDVRFNRVKRICSKTDRLIEQYQPSVLVLPDRSNARVKGTRSERYHEALTQLALERDLPITYYAREQIAEAFQASSKDERARLIAKYLPELRPDLPPRRRCFDREHHQMQMFDSVGLALTYFYLET